MLVKVNYIPDISGSLIDKATGFLFETPPFSLAPYASVFWLVRIKIFEKFFSHVYFLSQL